jgi:hypothetical protein
MASKMQTRARRTVALLVAVAAAWLSVCQVDWPLLGEKLAGIRRGFLALAQRLSWPAAALAGLGLVSTASLVREARHQGKQIALVAPFLALVRAAALDLGLHWGLLDRLIPRR